MSEYKAKITIEGEDKASPAFSKTQASLISLNSAIELCQKAWNMLSGPIRNFVNSAIEAENADVRLAQALASHNKYTKEGIKDLSDYADALKEKIGVSNEDIKSTMAMTAAMTDLDTEGLKKVAISATDLAARFKDQGMTVESAGVMIAKTLSSDVNALGRYGIEVKGAVGSSERLASVLSGINSAAGGAAEALANTTEGGLNRLKESVDDVKESIGGALLPTINNGLIPSLQNLLKWFKDLLSPERLRNFSIGLQATWSTLKLIISTAINGLKMIKESYYVIESWLFKSFENIYHTFQSMMIKIKGVNKDVTAELLAENVRHYKELARLANENADAKTEIEKLANQNIIDQQSEANAILKTMTEESAADRVATETKSVGEVIKVNEELLKEYQKLRDEYVDKVAKDIVAGNFSIEKSINDLIKQIEEELIKKALQNLIDKALEATGILGSLGISQPASGGAGAASGGAGAAAAGSGVGAVLGAAGAAAVVAGTVYNITRFFTEIVGRKGGLFGGWSSDWLDTPEGQKLKNRSAANGYDGIVTEPTLFLTGEAGRERVTVTPLTKHSSNAGRNLIISVQIDRKEIGRAAVDYQKLKAMGLEN